MVDVDASGDETTDPSLTESARTHERWGTSRLKEFCFFEANDVSVTHLVVIVIDPYPIDLINDSELRVRLKQNMPAN